MSKKTTQKPQIETVTVQALVTLSVIPTEGQTPAEAAEQMQQLFAEYLTHNDSVFLSDYGASVEGIAEYRADPENVVDPTWGGYDGPYVATSTVQAIAAPAVTEKD